MNRQAVQLKAKVDAIVAKMHADGTYARLYREHFKIDPPTLTRGTP